MKWAAAFGYGFFLLAAAFGHIHDPSVQSDWTAGIVDPTLWSGFLIPFLMGSLILRGAD